MPLISFSLEKTQWKRTKGNSCLYLILKDTEVQIRLPDEREGKSIRIRYLLTSLKYKEKN